MYDMIECESVVISIAFFKRKKVLSVYEVSAWDLNLIVETLAPVAKSAFIGDLNADFDVCWLKW